MSHQITILLMPQKCLYYSYIKIPTYGTHKTEYGHIYTMKLKSIYPSRLVLCIHADEMRNVASANKHIPANKQINITFTKMYYHQMKCQNEKSHLSARAVSNQIKKYVEKIQTD